MIDIIGAPFDLCGKRIGTRLGPAAVRLAGIVPTLASLGLEVQDLGDMPFKDGEACGTGMKCFEQGLPTFKEIKSRVAVCLQQGDIPLVIGGDHSISIGSVAGALDAHGEDLALLWMDAHADLNTPATTPSGNLHGMPVAALLGLPSGVTGEIDRQWNKITPATPLRQDHLAYFGIRELDGGEQRALAALKGPYTATMHEIDRHGIVKCMERFDHWMRSRSATHLWISFDVDMLDPFLAPGTGTMVRGGLSYREGHLVAEILRELFDTPGCPYKLVGMDLVEANPLCDHHNETAVTAVEWIASIFGKTILGKR